jgi:hypothetical protein
VGQLGSHERAAGRSDEAERHTARARAGFDELLAHHPAAYAEHAAFFFLGAGDATRALSLARDHLAASSSAEAWALLIDAALAAAPAEEACRSADAALAACARRFAARLHALAARAFAACGRPSRAAEEIARLSEPLEGRRGLTADRSTRSPGASP